MKSKKILWTIGSVTAIASPVVAVVSCGKKANVIHKTRTDGLIHAFSTGNGLSSELHKLVKLKNLTDHEVRIILSSARASKYVPTLLKSMLKDTDSSVKMWKNLLNKGEASRMYNAFIELSTKGLKNMTKRDVIVNLNHTVGQVITNENRNAIVALYNSKYNTDAEVHNAFNAVMNTTSVNNNEVAAGSQTIQNYNDAVAVAWIKNHMTVKEMESIIDKMPSAFIRTFRPVVSGILENLDLNMGSRHISFTKQTAASDAALLVNIVNDAWTHPIGYQGDTSLYAVSRLDDLRALSENNETIKSILNLIHLLTGAATNAGGIAGELNINNLSTGDNRANAVKLIDSIMSLFLKKEVKPGSPEGTISAFDKTAPLIRGLLLGFESKTAFENSIKALAPSLGERIDLIQTSVASAFAHLYDHTNLDSVLHELSSVFAKDFTVGVHQLITKGLMGMTTAEISKLLSGMRTTTQSSLMGVVEKQFSSFKIANMGIITWLKSLLTEHTIIGIPSAIHDIIHSPMKDIKPESFNALIELINSTKLLKNPLPFFGEALYTLIHDSPSTITAGQLSAVMQAFNLGDSTNNLIMNLVLGHNYQTQGIASIKQKAAALHLANEITFAPGSNVPDFGFTYAQFKTQFLALQQEISAATSTANIASIYNKYTEMQAIIVKVDQMNELARPKNLEYENAFTKAQNFIKTMPAEIKLTVPAESRLISINDSWAQIHNDWTAKVAEYQRGATVRRLKDISELEDIIKRANKLNSRIAFINKYHSIDVTQANLNEILKVYFTSPNGTEAYKRGANGLMTDEVIGKSFYLSKSSLNELYDHGLRIFEPTGSGVVPGGIIGVHGQTMDGMAEVEKAALFKVLDWPGARENSFLKLVQNTGSNQFHI